MSDQDDDVSIKLGRGRPCRHGATTAEIHLTRLSTRPELYSVTFQTVDGLLGGQWDRRFSNLYDVSSFLRRLAIPSPVVRGALADVRLGKTSSIANVVLRDDELRDFRWIGPARRRTG
jgi:hypothetical protein